MLKKFRRIISSGDFIPEIDGLRFIAIASVFFYHLNGFIQPKIQNNYLNNFSSDILDEILSVGYFGVQLFFVISGFILSRPFAKMYINDGPKVIIKKYFYRRLTRLEPPYILVMSALLFGSIYVAKNLSPDEALRSYLFSIFYVHTLFYDGLPLLNVVAWSLEVEIQFYILMPFLALIFKIHNKTYRRMLIVYLIFSSLVFAWINFFNFKSILNYLHYFLIGMLLADYSLYKGIGKKNIKFAVFLSTISFISIWGIEIIIKNYKSHKLFLETLQMLSIFLFYYIAIINKSIKFLKVPIITTIGGMCYTIYLVHYPIISVIGNPLVKISFSNSSIIDAFVYSLILTFVCLLISSLFFLIIERPCMDKDWFKKLIIKLGL